MIPRTPCTSCFVRYLFVLAAAVAAFVLYAFTPGTSGIFPPCPLRASTGLYCPGCGTLRALHQLLHGNIARAFGYNPLLIVSLPAIGLLLLFPKYGYRPWVAYSACAILVAFGILRNIPCWPWVLLAPQ